MAGEAGIEATSAVRTCTVWCPDWPVAVVSCGDPGLVGRPVAVLERVGPREQIRCASAEARAAGVQVGMRRREAESRCAELMLLGSDLSGEAAAFEVVARAVEQVTPRAEVSRPGVISFPARGPSRYFGGDASMAATLQGVVARAVAERWPKRWSESSRPGGPDVRVGVADSRFASGLAARSTTSEEPMRVVARERSAEFLGPFPVSVLGDVDFADLLVRLGLQTLAALAELPAASVLARFGPDGRRLHRLAGGFDADVAQLAEAPADLVEQVELDPPLARVDEAAFVAKALGDRLLARLADLGLGCTRVLIEAETEHGERLARRWRHEGALTPRALAERVRWQLDGWLQDRTVSNAEVMDPRQAQDSAALGESFMVSAEGSGPQLGALTLLRLVPDEVVASSGRQLGFWGGDPAMADRADRALARVQGMLGYESVGSLVLQGGRTPAERVRWVPWGEPREALRPLGEVQGPVASEVAAWPGAIPGPAPTRVFDPPWPAELVDRDGVPVRVDGRGELSSDPARLVCEALEGGGGRVVDWSGPWVHDVRWWDLDQRLRLVLWRVSVETDGRERRVEAARHGRSVSERRVTCLVATERDRAHLDAIYD